MKLEFYDLLIESATEASQRARWILTATIVTSLTVLGAVYNFGLSQLRKFIELLVVAPVTPSAAGASVPNEALKELQTALVKSWVEQLSVNINLIGLKFFAADATFIGSLALVIVTTWLFFGIRRENHIIGRTLRMASNEGQDLRAYVYYGLSNTQVFATVTDNDAPIMMDDTRASSAWGLRRIAVLLLYLPAITSVVMLVADLLSLFHFSAIFRGRLETVYEYLSPQPDGLRKVLPLFLTKFVIQFVVMIFLLHVTRVIHELQQGTIKALRLACARGWGKVYAGDAPVPSRGAGAVAATQLAGPPG